MAEQDQEFKKKIAKQAQDFLNQKQELKRKAEEEQQKMKLQQEEMVKNLGQQANRERANLEQRLNELKNAISSEEGRSKALEKSKLKYERTIAELEERLKRNSSFIFNTVS